MNVFDNLQSAFDDYREKELILSNASDEVYMASCRLDDIIPNVENEIREKLKGIVNYNSYDLCSVCENIAINMFDDTNYIQLDFGMMDLSYGAIKEIKEKVFPNNELTLRSIDDCLIITILF